MFCGLVLGFVLLLPWLPAFFVYLTVFWLVYHPFHVVDAPVECLGANLFLFWFFFFGWQCLPFLILFLRSVSALWWLSLLLSPLTLFLTLLELVDELR